MSNWKDNHKIYDSWLEMVESDEYELRDMVCQSQFGYLVSDCKMVWVKIGKTTCPLILVPDLTKKELETKVLPAIIGRFAFGTCELVAWPGYPKIREDQELKYRMVGLSCALCSLQ